MVAVAALAGYVFMEMTARLTIVSQRTLGEILRDRGGRLVPPLTFAAVLFGCMAYQAGNLLGALGGLQLLFPALHWWLLPLAGAVTALLWSGSTARIGRVMTYVVAGMGLLFLVAAIRVIFGGGGVDTSAAGVDPAVLFGLIGTTIVPYNFFLAAGLGSGAGLADMRRGLGLSFIIGMLITAAILVVGSVAITFVSFSDLADTLEGILGSYGRLALGTGLFAAGFSSAATAPLAAAVAGRELLGIDGGSQQFRGIWLLVLLTGLGVALLQLDIIGVIVIAQVINGLLLPFIAVVVFVLANRRSLMGEHVNRWWQNVLAGLVLLFICYKAGELMWNLIVQ
ncbi:divalent metal cation transporter [Lewinella sp. JB7]|nr:divalent metal cation transporter [Lewinella sp. JB7]